MLSSRQKKDHLRIWINYVPPPSNSKAIRDDKFTGKVVEVVSGDCIVVADDSAPYGSPLAERRVNLSSIRDKWLSEQSPSEVFAADRDEEANSYFQQIFIGQLTIDDVMQKLAHFKESSVKREKEIFACMIQSLFDEFCFFSSS